MWFNIFIISPSSVAKRHNTCTGPSHSCMDMVIWRTHAQWAVATIRSMIREHSHQCNRSGRNPSVKCTRTRHWRRVLSMMRSASATVKTFRFCPSMSRRASPSGRSGHRALVLINNEALILHLYFSELRNGNRARRLDRWRSHAKTLWHYSELCRGLWLEETEVQQRTGFS